MRARPTIARSRPFNGYARPKWWHEAKAKAEGDAVRKLCGNASGMTSLSAMFKVVMTGAGLTDEQRKFFDYASTDDLFAESPFLKLLPKANDFRGDGGWR